MITLLNDYYSINSRIVNKDNTVFGITLLPAYCAYAGHFPGNPVSPGACSMQLIKECAEQIVGKRLFLAFIAKCRFSAVMTPQLMHGLQLRMQLSPTSTLWERPGSGYQVRATLFDANTTYIEFKGELIEKG